LALDTDERSASRSACITLSSALGTHCGRARGRDHLKHASVYRWCKCGDVKWLELARDSLLSTGSEFSVSAIGDEFTDQLNYCQLLTRVTVTVSRAHDSQTVPTVSMGHAAGIRQFVISNEAFPFPVESLPVLCT